MGIQIIKAKLAKGNTIEATYYDEGANLITHKGVNACHSDCLRAFDALTPYFAEITEQREYPKIDWENVYSRENAELLRYLEVTGISIKDDDDMPSVAMSGRRELRSSQVININAPATALEPSGAQTYRRFSELAFALQRVLFEVEQYVVGGKCQASQGEIDFGTEDPFEKAEATDDINPADN